ncbi:amidase family protein [Pedococcus sp. KACC 23699]|uniref:Amidase family protein n=1 Tax=Pedococcus sp. KACC 23699 TaxID=3149228 RepID=A0AAU7JQ50_9MICO
MSTAPAPTTASALAEDVRRGRTTAVTLVREAIGRIEQRDPAIGAFQVVRAERAVAEATAVDARDDLRSLPLAGVPVAVKDNVPVAGEPMRVGTEASDPTPQTSDHPVVARLRAAGAVVVGLTRVPELCVYGATDSVFGITRNPWDTSRTSGGSSGGSAAAVAAGMVPVAHGNDGMGSIRIPAACCGLVGIKPGADVVPSELGNGSWFGFAENGPLTTTVADSALLLSVMADQPGLASAASADPGRLRIAVTVAAPARGIPVDPQFVTATRSSADLLRGAGHRLVERTLRVSPASTLAGVATWCAGTERDAQLMVDRTRLSKPVARHARAGRVLLRAGLPRESARAAWRATALEFFEDVDLLLTPGLAQEPLAADRWSGKGWLRNLRANSSYAPFGAPWNMAGWPAIVVPTGQRTTSGLPLSVQLVAPPGGEARLLSVAAQLEQLAPWPLVAPAYAGATAV